MTDLLDKLQHATEGSRELSDQMLLACGWTYGQELATVGPGDDDVWVWRDEHGRRVVPFHGMPDPSRNLQDAVSLVPEGSYMRMELARDHKTAWVWIECAEDEGIGYGPPALALCIAIIKAHESKTPKLTDAQKRVIDDLV